MTLLFDVFSKKVGTRPSVASMTTSPTKGTTIVTEPIPITLVRPATQRKTRRGRSQGGRDVCLRRVGGDT